LRICNFASQRYDTLLTWPRRLLLKPSRDIVFRHPEHVLLLKLIVSIDHQDRCCRVAGIRRESTSAMLLGAVNSDSVIGMVIRRIALTHNVRRMPVD